VNEFSDSNVLVKCDGNSVRITGMFEARMVRQTI
jgi:hypothetical protein